MTGWPEAIAVCVLAVCALGAWIAWLKWGQREETDAQTALRLAAEPTWRSDRSPWSACTCGQTSNLPCPVHRYTTDPEDFTTSEASS